MEKLLIILLIIAIVIFIVCILSILVISNKKRLFSLNYKIEISNKTLNEKLKSKLDLTLRIINIIERKLKIESKTFKEVRTINAEKMNNIVADNILNEAYKEIIEIKDDYKELSKIKSFNGIIDDIKDLDVYITGSKKFYNKYASLYNNLLKTFITKILNKKCKNKSLYNDGNLTDNLKIDFTI